MKDRPILPVLLVAASLLSGLAPAQTALDAGFVTELTERARQQFGVVGIELAVVQDGEVLALAAAGQRGAGQPMTPDTVCNIASVSKQFTAAAVAMLIAEGKLDWDDRVVDHLPEFRMSDPWITSQMTVRDLLSHRCGLKTFAGDLLWYGSDYDDDEVVHRIEKLPITQPFRGMFGYQNLMFLVAGEIVERHSGLSWEEFVEQRIFAPLAMEHSRASAQRLTKSAERAVPHIGGEPVDDHLFVACKPAAAIYSSVHDLTSWMRLLLAGGELDGTRLLSAAALREMWKPHVQIGGGDGPGTRDFRSYGLGWFLSIDRGNKVVEHDGGMPGFLSKLSLMPAERFGFVVLNNGNDGVVNEGIKRAIYAARAGGDGFAELDRFAEIAKRIARRDASEVARREAQRLEGTKPRLPLADYTGRYEDETYGPAEVTLDGDALHVVLLPSRRRLHGTMSHWHDDTFRVDFPDRFLPFALFRFDFDFAGKVAGFRIDCPIADFDFGALDFRKRDR
ncbi:MAG: serine hydrolase [Planctomycetes bacterium]|nr:serine hydrolase [Planctomycetota bacterium]